MNYTDHIDIRDIAYVESWSATKLWDYIGGLSDPSKMPCHGFAISARKCITGGKLQKIAGTVCYGCYAMKGNYLWPGTRKAHARRYRKLNNKRWVAAMARLITLKEKSGYFRWHDSGDLQSVEHFARICAVVALTPHIRHWIPTREYKIVADYLRNGGEIPDNFSVRMSAHKLGGIVPKFAKPLVMSSVSRSDDTYPDAHHCPARFQKNFCLDCRACWDTSVPHVDYHAH